MSANHSTSKSSTLSSIKSSFIDKVSHATVRRQRSAVDTCVSDVTSAPTDGLAADIVTEVAAEGRASTTNQSTVRRRRIRSPFSSSRLFSEPNKPTRSSLAEQRIIESVVFRPSATLLSGRSTVNTRDDNAAKTGGSQRRNADIADSVDNSTDMVVQQHQRPATIMRSLSQGQDYEQPVQLSSSSTLVRSMSANNTREPLLLFVNGNFNKLPYNSESYLLNRAAACSRRGFGGNYRRHSPRPEACSTSARSQLTSSTSDTSTADNDDSWRRLGTQSMPGTLDRRYCNDRQTPFDAALLTKAVDNLSQSYHEGQAAALDLSPVSSSMWRSSDIIETGSVTGDSPSTIASNLASSDIETTPRESADVVATSSSMDAQDGVLLKTTSAPAAYTGQKPTHSRGVFYRQRRSRSDEASLGRRRRKQFIGQNVGGLRRRRCRSLERRQSSTETKHLRCDELTSPGSRRRSSESGCSGTVRKTDSFDSGIDTKSDSTSPRIGTTDDVVDSGVNSQANVISLPSAVTLEVLSLTAAEVEYDRNAATLIGHLGDDDAELRRVLSSSASHRVPTCYVSCVFDNVVRPLSSTFRDVDECSSLTVVECSSAASDELKTSLLCGVRKKLEVLAEERQCLANQLLQTQQAIANTSEIVDGKVSGKLCEMYHLYVNELSKVLRLLLMLASRLARADNALASTTDNSSNHTGALVIKRDEVRQRFHDALELKTGIDRRRERLDAALRDALTPDELSDFRCSVDSMCRLRLDSQWVDDRIDISQIELNALMDNILSFSQATEC